MNGQEIEQLKQNFEIGIIGAGDMGQLYATQFRSNGWKNINICDLPSKYDELLSKYPVGSGIKVLKDGYLVSRQSDFIIYSVEAENLDKVVGLYGPATKVGAIVAGQTSVKAPEIAAFEKYLPKDVEIITCHSMHGPKINPVEQPLAFIEYRNSEKSKKIILEVLKSLKSNLIELNYKEHDDITANTQAVTHLAFISMGAAWMSRKMFPWETKSYVGGIENAKVNVMLRIFSNKWHVYAGLALLNPSAKKQVLQYAESVKSLFELMIQEKEDEFKDRILEAGKYIFKEKFMSKEALKDLLLSNDILDQFSMAKVPPQEKKPNSHLSLLAIVDSWYQMKIDPYNHIVCQTPPFRVWLGIVEYLFTNYELLNETMDCALHDKEIRLDDLSFFSATQSWAQTINLGVMESYKKKFLNIQNFFESRLKEGQLMSSQMFELIIKNTKKSS
ncbi:hypothetical protein K502DRAFT_315450 [Neoconidiobolus thromboides FSU 785]|nr:hypothetical protein K502DRAFT_315450 [Neoconidiobolus thromboides FSU 785]